MNNKKIRNTISNILAIILVIIAIIIYRKYDFNFFTKGIQEEGKTTFSRDSEIKYSNSRSYKIENKITNDAMFYREIEVEPNTPYKVTCMVKTENVVGDDNNPLAGAQICLNGTEEHSRVLSGDNDWTKIEFLFNSKCNESVEVGFRLGGNLQKASGTAWFSDLTIEEGFLDTSNTWNFGCFIIDNIDVVIEGKRFQISMPSYDKTTIVSDMRKTQLSIAAMSNNQMNITYDIIEIQKPLTTLTYDPENGYYITEKDVYNLIDAYVKEKDYDHIFVCTNLPFESELTTGNVEEWIGLGNMMYLGKGFSNIKITTSEYYNPVFPEEVYIHEFLHTLERNSSEYGYTVPALHDYEKYNYSEEGTNGLKTWYIDYMNGKIISNGKYIGLPSEIYTLKPPKQSDFEFSYELDLLDEPSNISETINSIIKKIKNVFKKEDKIYSLEGVSN